jgi:hypothetical protein
MTVRHVRCLCVGYDGKWPVLTQLFYLWNKSTEVQRSYQRLPNSHSNGILS